MIMLCRGRIDITSTGMENRDEICKEGDAPLAFRRPLPWRPSRTKSLVSTQATCRLLEKLSEAKGSTEQWGAKSLKRSLHERDKAVDGFEGAFTVYRRQVHILKEHSWR